MKALNLCQIPALVTFLVLSASLAGATTYYSKSSGNANSLSTWGTNPDGSGTNPSSFGVAGDIFIITSGSTLGLTANWTIPGNVTLQVDGNISVTSNNHDISIAGTVVFTNPNSTQVSLTGGGNGNSFTLTGGATLKSANLNGIRGTNCSLPATASGTISLHSNANYEFIGNGIHEITGMPASVKNLIVNVTGRINISSSLTVVSTINLANGILNIAPGATLTLSAGGNITGSGFGSGKHINTQFSGASLGYFQVNSINGNFNVPIGDGSNYLPVSITTTTNNDFRFNVFQGLTKNGVPNGTPFTPSEKNSSVDAVWTINRITGAGNVTLVFNWPSSLKGAGFNTYANTEIGVALNSGTAWGSPIGSGNQAANTATITGITTFGKFGVGKVGIPLPLKFGEIKLTQGNSLVNISWKTLTEFNVDRYIIERSADGISFSSIGSIIATGNNYSVSDYLWKDLSPSNGSSFYRIRAIDIDGKETVSSIIRFSLNVEGAAALNVYPNPVRSIGVSIQVTALQQGIYQLVLSDMNGKEVVRQEFHHGGGFYTQHILLPEALSRGQYFLAIRGSIVKLQRLVLVQ